MEPLSNEPTLASTLEVLPTDSKLAKSPSIAPVSLREVVDFRDLFLRTLAIFVALGITIVFFLFVDLDQIRHFQEYGYFGIFMASLISNASIALPIPSLFFTFIGGGTFNWIIVGLVSGTGQAIGESTGYLAGYGGAVIIENKAIYSYKRVQQWMKKHGILTIFMLSVVPNPIIALAGIAAGTSGFGYHKFLFSCWLGKTTKTLIVALAGAYSITWLLDYLA